MVLVASLLLLPRNLLVLLVLCVCCYTCVGALHFVACAGTLHFVACASALHFGRVAARALHSVSAGTNALRFGGAGALHLA